MNKAVAMRLSDVEAVFQLVQQCRELWADAPAWQRHLLRSACRMTGTVVGFYNELRISPDGKTVHVLEDTNLGWRDEQARSHYLRMKSEHPDYAKFLPRCTELASNAEDGQITALLRQELRQDHEWRCSVLFNEYWRPADLDEYVIAFSANRHTGSRIMLAVNQQLRGRGPDQRSKAILSLLARQLAPLVGTVLATGWQPGVHQLSPRLRQTLNGLLAGESEKQIAARLGLSRATLHEYVGAIFRKFDVQGRAELMAHFIHRRLDGGTSTPATSVVHLATKTNA